MEKVVSASIKKGIDQAIQALVSGEPLSEEMRSSVADKLKQTEQDLDKVKSWIKSAESHAEIGTWVLDYQHDKLFWSDQIYRILEYNIEEFTPSVEAYFNRIHPEDRPRVQQGIQESVENNNSYEGTYRLQLPNDQIKYVEIHASHFYNEAGEAVSTIGTTQDVTHWIRDKQQLEDSLEENRTQLREIHHRVKNNLAVVAGLLQLQWLEEDDPEIINTLKEGANRMKAVAGIHQQLYESGDYRDLAVGENITRLATDIISTMESGKEINLVSNYDSSDLNMKQTMPCTLIANEVVTNSIKHAFEGREKGTITIDLTTSDNLVRLQISDNGVGLPEDFNSRKGSLGMNLIETLSNQLEADYNFSSSEEGTTFYMQFLKEEREEQ